MPVSDEACIAIALLHGATFWPQPGQRPYVEDMHWAIDVGFNETMTCLYKDGTPATDQAKTVAEAARKYCKRHNLLG